MVTKASKGPSLLVDQKEATQSDNDDHRGLQIRFSPENPSFVDCETNLVDESTYTDQPKLNKDEANRVAQAVQTLMESQNFKALVTAGRLKAFGLIPKLINDRNHILNLDPILGKIIRALKSVKIISKEDAKTAEKQGIAPPDDPNLAKDYDTEGLDPNAATAGSGVAATVSTTGTDAPTRRLSGPTGNLRKIKWKLPSGPKGPKVPRTLSVPSKSQKGSSELTDSEPIDSIFKDLGTILEWEVSKIVTNGSSKKIQKDTTSSLPEQTLVPNVTRPSATLSGFFSVKGSAHQAPAEATGSLLSELNRLDSSVALRWAMTGKLSFGSAKDFEAFNAGNMVDQGQKSLHFLTILLRKCDLVVKDRERLTGHVSRLVEEKGKLLADNAKLLASHGGALAAKKMKNEENARRIAALEKQRDSLEFRLKDYESNFEMAKTEIGVRAIDLFKHSPAFETFTHREFMRGVKACKNLVRSMEYPIVANQIDESLRLNVQEAEENLKKQITSSQSGNLWLDPLIDYGPDSESEGEEFYEEELQDEEGDREEGDQGEEEEEEIVVEEFQGDTGADLGGPERDGNDDN
ncbi:hypothetical protein LWI29_003342 [Acer saccharum]|uniref:Uncharacterized protein n=1 Tax=Acer saccharum TaxID=4024 RepID=A0AA39VDE2_ACESA|nr:hypothetical protein LWI29_003342 [Acer saccharum]